jgi:integrase/recombinase XerD
MVLPPLSIDWENDDTREIEFLTQAEILQLYKATYLSLERTPKSHRQHDIFSSRDRAMLTVYYGCGLRRNEGYNLDLSDINFDKQILHVRKGKNYKERFVPFNTSSQKHLEQWVYDNRPQLVAHQNDGAFFISQRGGRMDTQSMALRLKMLQERTGDIALKEKNVRLHAKT